MSRIRTIAEKLNAAVENDRKKVGGLMLPTMGRLGVEEVRRALYPDSNVVAPTMYGMPGTLTPGEVAADRREEAAVQGPDQEPDPLAQAQSQARDTARDVRPEKDRGMGK